MTRLFPVALLALSGCAPSLRMEVLQPSLVTSPPEIRSLTVVDRSRAKNVGQGVLGALEGALTGEAIGADNAGRNGAMSAAVATLRSSPRFEAAGSFTPRKELEASLFDKLLSWETAQRICADAGCQGIVALEAFDSDSRVDVARKIERKTVDGKSVERPYFEAQRTTHVTTAWRYYDVANQQVLDDMRTFDSTRTWTARGDTARDARNRLPRQVDTVGIVGELAGADYAARIAPVYVVVSRTYYGRGSDQLKLARDRVRAMDWPGAAQIWQQIHAEDPDPKLKGKAAYNLALAAERDGYLEDAAAWATEAATLLPKGRTRAYRRTLEGRLADEAMLERQMQVAPPPPSGKRPFVPPPG